MPRDRMNHFRFPIEPLSIIHFNYPTMVNQGDVLILSWGRMMRIYTFQSQTIAVTQVLLLGLGLKQQISIMVYKVKVQGWVHGGNRASYLENLRTTSVSWNHLFRTASYYSLTEFRNYWSVGNDLLYTDISLRVVRVYRIDLLINLLC